MPDESAVRSMNALRRLVSALRSPGAAAPDGMSVAQHFALRVIGKRPGLTMSELAEATLTTRSAVSEVVSRLAVRGLLTRSTDPVDTRKIRLHLTPEGEAVWNTVGDAVPEQLVRSLAGMTPEVRARLAASLESWVAAAGLNHVPPAMFGEKPLNRTERGRTPSRGESHAIVLLTGPDRAETEG